MLRRRKAPRERTQIAGLKRQSEFDVTELPHRQQLREKFADASRFGLDMFKWSTLPFVGCFAQCDLRVSADRGNWRA